VGRDEKRRQLATTLCNLKIIVSVDISGLVAVLPAANCQSQDVAGKYESKNGARVKKLGRPVTGTPAGTSALMLALMGSVAPPPHAG
ncbi:MAG: hypothetical protein FWF13_06285, partial [Acidobacteria bacterium]|nr:hypothetical protein [Acidobacteriota bacterium]